MTSDGQFPFGQSIVWRPTETVVRQSRLMRFMERHGLQTFEELLARSTSDVAWFWEAVFEDLGIQFYEPYTQVLDLSEGIQFPRWCVGGRLNIVYNCLDRWIGTPAQNRVAIRWEGEEGTVRLLTYRDLHLQVGRMAAALRAAGLGKGDVIGLYMPMTPEIVIAFLAIAKVGAIILPLFSGYGPGAVAMRLADAGARALFVSDGAYRRGRVVPMKATADAALVDAPTVEKVIVSRRTGIEPEMLAGRDVWWDEFLRGRAGSDATERTSAEDLLMIIYTSGTTGRPKGAVHTHCGFPIKSAQDMAHGFDIGEADTMSWLTDMGWMMGPWEVFGVLILGATMVLSDTAPDYPDVDRVWAMVERHGITCLGLSPTFVRAIMAHGDEPVRRHDLSSLRILGSTGEPWNPGPWGWLFDTVGGGRVPIINYSGGTEVSGGIVVGNVLSPVKPCAFSGPAPGMAADVVDETGASVRGRVGELVVRRPWIGMTRGFWRDPERYLESYWSRLPDVWVHGDLAAIDEDGLWYILGRSDDTIKVAGKRIGPAEIETLLVAHPGVIEAAAIGVPDEVKGQAVVALVVLKSGLEPSESMRAELGAVVARELGKPLAPKAVLFVRDLPKTRNAKVMRRVIRAAYLGQPVGDLSALVNPEAIDEVLRAQ